MYLLKVVQLGTRRRVSKGALLQPADSFEVRVHPSKKFDHQALDSTVQTESTVLGWNPASNSEGRGEVSIPYVPLARYMSDTTRLSVTATETRIIVGPAERENFKLARPDLCE